MVKSVEQARLSLELITSLLRSVIESGFATLRVAMLINGGAAIALLAFLGNLATSEAATDSATPFARALASFAIGAFVAALGVMFAFLAQTRSLVVVTRFVQQQDAETRKREVKVFYLVTVALVLGAFILFGVGVWHSYAAIFQPSPMSSSV